VQYEIQTAGTFDVRSN